MLFDRKFRVARKWSNSQLKLFSHLFTGDVANISGWKDVDKQGLKYIDYFSNSRNYTITNYKSSARGYQGNLKNEIFLDLEQPLPDNLIGKFDVVFNHTVLEHIFNVDYAFQNLTKMTRDIAIIVVPFLQEQHGLYGDYWRFTPLAVRALFKKNNMELIYIDYNDCKKDSIYVFAIGSKHKSDWDIIYKHDSNKLHLIDSEMIGTKIISNILFFSIISRIINKIKNLVITILPSKN